MKTSSREGPRGALRSGAVAVLVAVLGAAGCTDDRPDHPLAGRAIHALGQEPGWMVDVDPDAETVFILDYGTDTVTAATPAPFVDGEATVDESAVSGDTAVGGDAMADVGGPREGGLVYRVESADPPLVLTLFVQDCTDAMSGHPFPYTAVLRIGDRELRGCAEPRTEAGSSSPGL